jgi:Flp pilus assembly protein TadD
LEAIKEKKMMNRMLIGFLAAAAFAVGGVLPVANAADTPTSDVTIFDEAHFLTAADDSAKRGDKDAAIQLYQSAIVYAPNDPVPYERLASFYAGNGQRELATQFFSTALDVQPAYAPAIRGLALLALASGNRAGAQAQHELLVRACGAGCPETQQVEKALNDSAAAANGSRP